jgi:signal transduction histidine kinase
MMEFFGHALDRLSFVVGRVGAGQTAPDERAVFLSTAPASVGSRRLAVAVVLVSVAGFLAAAPFATIALTPVWAFVPAYESALIINDLVTVTLLIGQFVTLRSKALLMLAAGYLFTACLAAAHALTFPGLFAATGLLGANAQSTAWIYMFWHAGFPLFVAAYSLLQDRRDPRLAAGSDRETWLVVAGAAAATLAGAAALVWLATGGSEYLPAIMDGNHYTSAMKMVVPVVWIFIAAALALLWFRRTHTVLDNWLLVTLCVWVFDVALSAVLNAGRFDLGFYAGRIYGLLAASFVLAVLLLESGRQYRRLSDALASEREKASLLAAANRELEAFSYSISHDLRAPLRAITSFSSILAKDHSAGMSEEAHNDLERVRVNARRMDQLVEDLLQFSRLSRQRLIKRDVDLAALAQEVFEELSMLNPNRRIEFHVGGLRHCMGDPSLLRQVIVNLLSNAVKFTRDRDPATIEIGCRQEGGISIYFVQDNGAGFDMKYAKGLFGVFQRMHKQEEFEGTGVGLSIAQRVIERHGGHIWAEATPGKGAKFYFTLEAHRA